MPERDVPVTVNGTIAVFGSADPRPGQPAYETARELGALLARAGYGVINGGYGGVMEAAARGVREAGGSAVGVACEIFHGRAPNRYLSRTIATPDLYARLRALIEPARGYVVLPGMSGTLSELTLLWALDRAGCLGQRPVVLLGAEWEPLIEQLIQMNMLEQQQIRLTRIVATPGEAVDHLLQRLASD